MSTASSCQSVGALPFYKTSDFITLAQDNDNLCYALDEEVDMANFVGQYGIFKVPRKTERKTDTKEMWVVGCIKAVLDGQIGLKVEGHLNNAEEQVVKFRLLWEKEDGRHVNFKVFANDLQASIRHNPEQDDVGAESLNELYVNLQEVLEAA